MKRNFKNGEMWYDDNSAPIQAHGGCIIRFQGIWYWYGEHKGTDNIPGTDRVELIGVSCYSSLDLRSWHYEGLALLASNDKDSPIAPSKICERPKIIYNEKTGKFVMWMHLDNENRTYAGNGIAVSDSPTGPFTLIAAKHPNRQDSRDMTIFTDNEGTAWLVHTSNWNRNMNLARLKEDYTDTDGFYVSVLCDQMREAPALFYEGGKYYMITSGCSGWEPNSALYAESDHMLGHWRLIDNPCEGAGYRKTFGGQSTYIFTAGGKRYLLLDHWNCRELKKSGYSILPVEVAHGIVRVRWTEYFESPVAASALN